jgi:histidine phosphotransfer protein HptB
MILAIAMTDPSPAWPAANPPGSVLDAQALDNLRQLDPGGQGRLLVRVLGTYRSSLARLMRQLDDAEGRADAAGMRLVAHTLKSSSASIGALELSGLCALAEQALRDGQVDGLAALLERLRSEASRVDRAVELLLAD